MYLNYTSFITAPRKIVFFLGSFFKFDYFDYPFSNVYMVIVKLRHVVRFKLHMLYSDVDPKLLSYIIGTCFFSLLVMQSYAV